MDADAEGANPLLIPPPPPGNPKTVPQPPADVNREAVETSSFISIPASVLDSATLRIASTRAVQAAVERDEADDIVFFPTPAAAPPAPVPELIPVASIPEPAPATSVPEPVEGPAPRIPASTSSATAHSVPEPVEGPDAPETAPTAIAPPLTWRIEFPDGAVVELAASALLGRNPADHPAAPGATLVRVDDPTKSVSKTHALLQLDGERLFVHDLGSTNGVYIVEPGREAVEVRPDHRVQLSGDSDLELGRFILKVRRG